MTPVSAHLPPTKDKQNNVVIYTGILLLHGNLETKNFFFSLNINHNIICKCSMATLNLITLTHFPHFLQYSTKETEPQGFQIVWIPWSNRQMPQTHNKTVTIYKKLKEKHVSYSFLLGCCFTMSSTKRQTKKTMPLHSQHYTVLHDTQID